MRRLGQVSYFTLSENDYIELNKEPMDFDSTGMLLGNNVISINGIEITDTYSDILNLAELKKCQNLRIKKYNDAIYFG